jgi:hypothetical protein
VEPKTAVQSNLVPELKGWVVESDHWQSIDDLDENVDLQTDVSPYTSPWAGGDDASGALPDRIDMNKQAEIFVGSRHDAESWSESEAASHKRADINLARTSNQLFADYQPHNSNVLSIIDTLMYKDGSEWKRIQRGKTSYYVLGWHTNSKDELLNLSDPSISRAARLKDLR